jgi:hypothetical protein
VLRAIHVWLMVFRAWKTCVGVKRPCIYKGLLSGISVPMWGHVGTHVPANVGPPWSGSVSSLRVLPAIVKELSTLVAPSHNCASPVSKDRKSIVVRLNCGVAQWWRLSHYRLMIMPCRLVAYSATF